MIYLLILVALVIGYVVGINQGGVHIHKYTETNYQPVIKKDEEPPESSVNLNLNSEDYVTFAQKNNGRIDY